MGTLNAGAHTPESAPQKVSAIPGLGKKIMTALAALGIATSAEKVEGATIIFGTGLSHSSQTSGPTLVQGLASTITSPAAPYNSRMASSTPTASDTSIDRIGINLSALDIGTGGTLTITGTIMGGTRGGLAGDDPGLGFLGSQFRVQNQAQFGLSGGPMTTIASFDSGLRNNTDDNSFNAAGEAWSHNDTFTYTLNITQSGTYNLDNVLIRQNATGNAQFQNFTLSYAPIPEASSALLAGGALGAALLRRRREKQNVE